MDGPTKWMIEYLEGHRNSAPESWEGMRDLDMKKKMPDFDREKKDVVGVGSED